MPPHIKWSVRNPAAAIWVKLLQLLQVPLGQSAQDHLLLLPRIIPHALLHWGELMQRVVNWQGRRQAAGHSRFRRHQQQQVQ